MFTTHETLRACALLAAAALVGCDDLPSAPEPMAADVTHVGASASSGAQNAGMDLSRDVAAWLRALETESNGFHRFSVATERGYVARLSECVESPAGGMGYHYGNPALIDGALDPLHPEIVLYEPGPSGHLRYVGVEFIVPIAAWASAAPPEVNGVPLHRNDGLGLWVLHVWTAQYNPTGVFEDFNPRVDCDWALESDQP